MSSNDEAAALNKQLNTRAVTTKGHFVSEITSAARLLLLWIGYARTSLSKNVADRLLDAVQASVVEVAASLTLGLVRPAIFSMRVQHELLLAWIFYNEHPVEWSHRERTNGDFLMRAGALKYLRDYDDRFADRFKLLLDKKSRSMDDPYGLLSIHVHTTSEYAAPSVGPLSSVIKSKAECEECVVLQRDVVEYLTDILVSWHASRWHDFPSDIQKSIQGRLGAKELKDFTRS